MPLSNSSTTYGSVTKTFHWLTALLILAMFPLGLIASDLAHEVRGTGASPDNSALQLAATLFSMHKTIGVALFFVALARIAWAIGQPKPALLNGDKPAEAWLAETVHWLLYGSLVAVPLSGWVHHAATSGFAPIWWPLGQSLPFVPRDEALADITGTLHYLLQWVLLGAIALHVTGALKHHLVDGDATLRRMLPGQNPALPTERQPGHVLPLVTALALWGAVLGGAASLGWFAPQDHAGGGATQGTALETVESEWQVQDGSLQITVVQMDSEVTGSFADWTASIDYSETPDSNGRHGSVDVTISIPSLTLGSVTSEALGADYFNADAFPTADFTADLFSTDEGHVARGTLRIRDESVPVEMPFTLDIEGDSATARGGLGVDRRAFGIGGESTGSLAASVDIRFDLTARRATP
ncbi:MAG: cytochrome b/b6 domain-containing protein [Pseudomonadota bacterium]|uniref:cytochrome b/b6 domain-containing protein n=1 Tax=Roseovarius salincola TaxID=2978479 RepID=UPI0022A695BC|nr:cytochrome b/b6 domain-containing protein [Roseovarius sp. EGI FJ00037]MCZ0810688.1 cytochrome b/b6 domain-containing protein [Roseovarius sp. EGI FJ00037]